MGTIFAYARLFRIEHALMLAVAVVLGELLASSALVASIPPWAWSSPPPLLPALPLLLCSLAVPIFIEMGSFALNDYLDVKTDKANKRKDRPIVSGEIAPSHALAAAALCYAIGIAAAFPLPTLALYITLAFAAASILYNYKLKDLPLLGNAYIAASMAIPFIFGNFIITGMLFPQIAAITLVAFISGLGREILKSAEDVEGDKKHRGSNTLPAVIGIENSACIASALYLILVPLSFLPFAWGLRANILSLGLVAITALSFLAMGASAARDSGKGNLTALRKASLASLAVGLLGYAASMI